jgi:vancomycin permeability regulator SanA
MKYLSFSTAILMAGILLLAPWGYISITTQGDLYRDITKLPTNEYGLLL